MFEAKVIIDPRLKKQAYRYPDVAAYAITDTLRRTRTEAKRITIARYPLLRKAKISWSRIFRIRTFGSALMGALTATSRKVSMAPFVTNRAATARQRGIPVSQRVPLQYTGFIGRGHTLPHGFLFRNRAQVSDPRLSDSNRFRTAQLVSLSQLLAVP